MTKLVVTGGNRLMGERQIPGAKNAVLPILAACMLTRKPVRLSNCPRLSDVTNMLSILTTIGCRVEQEGDCIRVDAGKADCWELPEELSKELRSSIFLLGPVLGRFHRAVVSYPGGCEIGNRPIDLHIKGLSAMQAKIREEGGRIYCNGEHLTGACIHLDYPSVGATENIMMAATAARGETVILNAAREPEIVDLQNFLIAAGFSISGAGTSTIQVQGGANPRPVEYRVRPDRIMAGTLLAAGAITGGRIVVRDVIPEDLDGVLWKLTEYGCRVRAFRDGVELTAPERLKAPLRIETMPHPGFPTDMQAQMFALSTLAEGTTVIVENVFENRFKHAVELRRMGGVNLIRDRTAVIQGVERLTGAEVTAHDLRGGAALALAGLAAEGNTTILRAERIARGYEDLAFEINNLGGRACFTE